MSPVDSRTCFKQIVDITIAVMKEGYSRWQRRSNPLTINSHNLFPTLNPDTMAYDLDELPWKKEGAGKKLVVLIHGLNSSPLAWSPYIPRLSEKERFIPFVHKKGYCKVKEAAGPILHAVQAYADQYPDNPIILVGHSNGARIAAYIEQKISSKRVYLISIAAPHLGAKLINWVDQLGLSHLLGIAPDQLKELVYEGPWAQKKLQKWQKSTSTEKKIERTFFASADDWSVFPNSTSFPDLPNSHYHLLTRESHVTIIDAVMEEVLKIISSSHPLQDLV